VATPSSGTWAPSPSLSVALLSGFATPIETSGIFAERVPGQSLRHFQVPPGILLKAMPFPMFSGLLPLGPSPP
jgi:hypothetical protein